MLWDTKRRVLYGLATMCFLATVTIIVFFDTFFPKPTCKDGKQNGFEIGVDCGGTCSLRCSSEVVPLTVLWSRAVDSTSGSYDLVGLVSNTNINNAARGVGYTFSVYNKEGGVVTTFQGTTTPPLDGKFPIIVQNVSLSEKPDRVTLTLVEAPHYAVRENPASPTVTILDRRYEKGQIPRLYAFIKNMKRIEVRNLEVRAILFDADDNAYAVGTTIIPFMDKEEVHEVVFTWNTPFTQEPTRIGIYPIFNPFQVRE
ncbi:MAG: hypothetical protein RLZZ308_380 [Candidatus Parcubacteria bacterium]|jgi:hypothetical protein